MLAIQHNSLADTLLESFEGFSKAAGSLLNIHNDKVYQTALNTLSDLMEKATDTPNDPATPLIQLLSTSIESYENTLPEVIKLDKQAQDMDAALSTFRLLMSQHGLTGSDFKDEIGGRSYVSQILSGHKKLTKVHIEKLSKRFNISPELFF